jgi:putative ABC transport system substrate-binding protein
MDIIVVQSARLPAYNSALQGFASTISKDIPARGLKSIQAHTIISHILSEVESQNELRQKIIRHRPDLLLVIGSSSLSLVKNIKDIPIIYLMVPYPDLIVSAQDNITGININITAGQQLNALVRTISQIKKIGLLFNPDRSGTFIKEAEDSAEHNSLSLVALPVKTAKEVPGQLAKLRDRIDCFWMLPDSTVVTPQTVDLILLFSLENRIPVLTFSEKYLEMGAVLSVSFDPYDMGKQAGDLALEIVDNNTKVADLPPVRVRKINVRVNHIAAKILGIVVEELINHE